MALLKPADEFEKHQRVERDAAIVVFFFGIGSCRLLTGLKKFHSLAFYSTVTIKSALFTTYVATYA